MDSLSNCDIAILVFERQFWRTTGAKDQAIRDQLRMTPVRFYQCLNQLLTSPAALRYDPVTVNRLRRIRARAA